MPPPTQSDPRIYMAAERTFLAWIRTAVALIAFGFVVARFGVSEIEMAGARAGVASLGAGLALITLGIAVCAISAVRHAGYIRAIDEGRFRTLYRSRFAMWLVALLVLLGVVLMILLLRQ